MKTSVSSGLAVLALSSCVHADWKIPAPPGTIHPGAASAPSSSPTTFEDEAAFQQRAHIVLQGLASNDLSQWRRGYFTGGDPGKYLPGAAMAKLILNPADEEARKYMNDERSYREHYHFAAVNWGRFLPLFGATLTPETQQNLAERAARFGAYLNPSGTENHRTMEWTTANVLPHFLVGPGGLSNRNKADSLAISKERLRQYVKGLYFAGQGEWDSSTYLMFDVNGLLNIYDFAPDDESRLLAKAGLDWLVAGFALKYRDGIYTAPHQRGFYDQPVESIAARTGWLWWGANSRVSREFARSFLYTLHPITSSYRPNIVLSNLAKKQVDLPFEARNTKPNYWHGHQQQPRPGQYHETVWNGKTYTLGSLWDGFGGQMTRLQLVAQTENGAVAFTGGHPRKSDHTGQKLDEISYRDGNGRYDQSAQIGSALISMSRIPDDEPLDYSFFSIPEGATAPQRRGKWLTMRVGATFLGLYPLAGEALIGPTDLSDKQKTENEALVTAGKAPKHISVPVIRFPGRPTGFVLETASANSQAASIEQDFEKFGASLEAREVDTARFESEMEVSYRALCGTLVKMKYQSDSDHAAVWFDGTPVELEKWQVYGSRYLSCENSVLRVNDGERGFAVDFSGDLPIYSAWRP